MNTKPHNLISQFLNSRFSFADTEVELADGTRICLGEIDNVTTKQDDKSVLIDFAFSGYKAQLSLCFIEENVLKLSCFFDPQNDNCPHIRRVASAKLNSSYGKNTRALFNGLKFGTNGIRPLSDADDKSAGQNFFSCFEKGKEKSAFTVITSLNNNKFKSQICTEKNEDTFSVSLETIFPYSFEGKLSCQDWIIYPDMPISDALEKDACRYSSNQKFETPIGWSTWDYYFTSATEDDVKQNVDFIAKDKILSKKVRYIALDDGWQQREGDWKSGIRYPSGLKHLTDYIKKKGFEAGIWVAPTRLHFLCGTVMRRYDFLIRDEYGDPVKDEDMYVLDPTHPEGEAFIRETFTYLANCGFTFYKLDFISNLLKYGDYFYDKNAGPYDALRKLIQIVRSVVPAGSHVMGCSLPYPMGTDWVDSRRTGWDIHNTWDHVRACLGSYLPQFASNEKIYRNDIDYLVVRGEDTSDDPKTNVLHPSRGKQRANPTDTPRWRGGDDFSYAEAKSWCTATLMSGSSVFMGDNLPLLNEKGIELVRKTVSNADFKSATPIITADAVVPEIWYKKDSGKLYVINFSKEDKHYSVPVCDYIGNGYTELKDIFTDSVYKVQDGRLEISLKPHDSLCLKPCTI